jgi:hypothetical protein
MQAPMPQISITTSREKNIIELKKEGCAVSKLEVAARKEFF